MAWSKLDIIGAALAEIGLGGYVFDATAQEKQDFLSRLDAMMASWQDDGINTGYGVEDDPSADTITGDSGISQEYVRAVIVNLAVEMAPSYGKQVMQQTLFAARKSYSRALRGGTPPVKSVNPTAVPAGAGHHYDSPQVFTLPGVDE
tara:strand:+ start:130 stop:570 length:441 start_codon:yes stop_codon:yes gene_type:complete